MNEQLAIILGNLISGLGMLVLFISTFLKDKRRMLAIQSFNHACSVVAGLMLKGYSGVVQDLISLARNVSVLRGHNGRLLRYFFIGSGLVLGVAFNNRGWLGLLPIIASTEYTVVVVKQGATERTLKWAIVASTLCWAVYSLLLYNVVNAAANVITMGSALWYLYRHRPQSGTTE